MGAGDFLKTVGKLSFPFISMAATAGGPFGTMAADMLGKVLGVNVKPTVPSIEEALSKASATPAELALARKAELDFQTQMAQMTNDKIKTEEDFQAHLEEIAAQDRASARAMQVQTKSIIVPLLSCVIVLGFLVMLLGLMMGWLKANEQQALLLLLGGLNTSFGAVVMYYFGSSAGSDKKTDLLAKSDAIKE